MEPEITNNKQEKIKDPRRVAAGKRLALISKEAKEKKKIERSEQSETLLASNEEKTIVTGPLCVVGLVGVGVLLGLLYFKKKQKPKQSNHSDPQREQSNHSDPQRERSERSEQSKHSDPQSLNMIESFD